MHAGSLGPFVFCLGGALVWVPVVTFGFSNRRPPSPDISATSRTQWAVSLMRHFASRQAFS